MGGSGVKWIMRVGAAAKTKSNTEPNNNSKGNRKGALVFYLVFSQQFGFCSVPSRCMANQTSGTPWSMCGTNQPTVLLYLLHLLCRVPVQCTLAADKIRSDGRPLVNSTLYRRWSKMKFRRVKWTMCRGRLSTVQHTGMYTDQGIHLYLVVHTCMDMYKRSYMRWSVCGTYNDVCMWCPYMLYIFYTCFVNWMYMCCTCF